MTPPSENTSPDHPRPAAELAAWLHDQRSGRRSKRYRHVLFREVLSGRSAGIQYLRRYAQKAHADAMAYFARLAFPSLDPLASPSTTRRYEGYPHQLHELTLQGYLGELMCGAIIENFRLFDHSDWVVPAFRFRYHNTAFEALERMRRDKRYRAGRIPGLTGDDCLAFRRDANGDVVGYLIAEAKCTQGHRGQSVISAHEQVSSEVALGLSTPQVIEILGSSRDPGQVEWRTALIKFLCSASPTTNRFNLVAYIYGTPAANGATRISTDRPHRSYTGRSPLKAVEVSISDVGELVEEIYQRPAVWEGLGER